MSLPRFKGMGNGLCLLLGKGKILEEHVRLEIMQWLVLEISNCIALAYAKLYHDLLIHSAFNRHLDNFQFGAIVIKLL